jgi:hypothetical protein
MDPTFFGDYLPNANSFAGQVSSMFRSSGTPPQTYVENKHLRHMSHLQGINPMCIRRCQITHVVQEWNARKGPFRSKNRSDFLDTVACLANTSVEQIQKSYSLVPVEVQIEE